MSIHTSFTIDAATKAKDGKVTLSTAYLYWLFGGLWGFHHAYLGRTTQALLWYSSFGYFGIGWLRDAFMLPYYVRLARSGPDADNRIREASIEATEGIPKWSVLRLVAMHFFGLYFSWTVSCTVALEGFTLWGPTAFQTIYSILAAIGGSIGVGFVASIGEETIDTAGGKKSYEWIKLMTVCLVVSLVKGPLSPVTAGMIYATYARKYRPSMVPKGRHSKRVGNHVLCCATFTCILLLAIHNHGHVNVVGRQIFISDVVRNAFNSDFWQQFNFQDFQKSGGAQEEGYYSYFEQTMDLNGNRAARRSLGVRSDATYDEIKSAYKDLALQFHPDKIGSGATAKEVGLAKTRFLEVQGAYETLSKFEKETKKQKHNDDATRTQRARKDEILFKFEKETKKQKHNDDATRTQRARKDRDEM